MNEDQIWEEFKKQDKSYQSWDQIFKNEQKSLIDQLFVPTFGTVQYKNEEIAITNPVQNIASDINNKFRGNNDLNRGVWIGRRALRQIDYIRINIDFAMIQINHWSVMVNGLNFSLETDTGSADGLIVIKQTNDKQYNWDFWGDTNRDINQVIRYVDYINKSQIPYQLLDDNCQKLSLKIALYANQSEYGIFDVKPINIEKYTFKSTAEGLFDTFEQEEQYRNEILPKILKQQKQYKEFEKKGYQMYQSKNVNQSYLGQTQRMPVTIGQTTQSYYKLPLQQQQQNKFLNNINYNSRFSTNPQFNLSNQQKVVQPFQNSQFEKPMLRNTVGSNILNNSRQSQYSNLNNQFQTNKKVKVDTSNFQLPDYQYDQNDYTIGGKKYVIM